MRRALLALALTACSDAPDDAGGASASLACGTLGYRVEARRVDACGSEVRDERRETVPFDRAVRTGAEISGALAELRAACAPERLAVTFSARAEASCDRDCRGSHGAVRVRWEGTLRLPAAASRWRARFVIDATRAVPRGADPVRGECTLTVPGAERGPIVVDTEHLEREAVVPAGDTPLRLDCDPLGDRGCYGSTEESERRFSQERWLETTLTVRIDARPDSP